MGDGFDFGFLKKMLDALGDDLTNAVISFFESGSLPKFVNTTWVALIPKVEGASSVSEYIPISMVGCIYKVNLPLLVGDRFWMVPSLPMKLLIGVRGTRLKLLF